MENSLEIISKLGAPLPKEAIQEAPASLTKKGYDQIGHGYQWVVNRLNEVCGDRWGYSYKMIKELPAYITKEGRQAVEIVVECTIWIDNPENTRKCVGGHVAISYTDALKGAITNAFKKTAAFWGVGKEAYEGTLDTDWSEQTQSDNQSSRFQSDPNVCRFKKYQGVRWEDVNRTDPDYLKWCLTNSKTLTIQEEHVIESILKNKPQSTQPDKPVREKLLARGHILLKDLINLGLGYDDVWYRKTLQEKFMCDSGAKLDDEKLQELCRFLEQELAEAKEILQNTAKRQQSGGEKNI